MKSLFARLAQVGEMYLSKKHWPVRVVEVTDKKTIVENLANGGSRISLSPTDLLFPYKDELVCAEARQILEKQNSASRDGKRLDKALDRVGDRRVIHKTYKGKDLTLTVKPDGYHCGGKVYKSLTAAAQGVTGTKITTGPAFWGFAKGGKK
jgi:hypothetical protein